MKNFLTRFSYLTVLFILFCSPALFAITGPIPLDESNLLPNGPVYGTVTLTLLPGACSSGYDGVQIITPLIFRG